MIENDVKKPYESKLLTAEEAVNAIQAARGILHTRRPLVAPRANARRLYVNAIP